MDNHINDAADLADKGASIRLPSLTLKDLIMIISVAVSIAASYGTGSARLTLIEKDLVELKESKIEMAKQIRRLEANGQDSMQFIDELYRAIKQPLPRRSNSMQSEY